MVGRGMLLFSKILRPEKNQVLSTPYDFAMPQSLYDGTSTGVLGRLLSAGKLEGKSKASIGVRQFLPGVMQMGTAFKISS